MRDWRKHLSRVPTWMRISLAICTKVMSGSRSNATRTTSWRNSSGYLLGITTSFQASSRTSQIRCHLPVQQSPWDSFTDHFSQARVFSNSMSQPERQDLIETFAYHLGKVKSRSVRQQNVEMFGNVDSTMATEIAHAIGVNPPQSTHVSVDDNSPSLSIANTVYTPQTQRVGVLIGHDFDEEEVNDVLDALTDAGAFIHVISQNLGPLTSASGEELNVDETFITAHPVLFDAFYVVGGPALDQARFDECIRDYVYSGYKSLKPIGIASAAQSMVPMDEYENPTGVITGERGFVNRFIDAISEQRFWDRT